MTVLWVGRINSDTISEVGPEARIAISEENLTQHTGCRRHIAQSVIRSLLQKSAISSLLQPCNWRDRSDHCSKKSLRARTVERMQVLAYMLCSLGALSYMLYNLRVVHKTPNYYSPALVPNLTVCNLLESKKSCINSVSQLSSTPRPAISKSATRPQEVPESPEVGAPVKYQV